MYFESYLCDLIRLILIVAMLRVTLSKFNLLFPFATTKPKAAEARIKQLFGECEQTNSATRMAVEAIRSKRSEEQIKNNEKINNYHYYEYFRGQDFIENVPYDRSSKYTLKDKLAEKKEKQRVSIEELQPISDHFTKAQLIRDRITAYHDKQRKYQIEEFQRYLKEYPGTVKGPKPEDDMDAYRAYAMRKMPKILLDQISQEKAFEKMREDQRKEEAQEVYEQPLHRIEAPTRVINNFGRDRILINEENPDEQGVFLAALQEGRNNQQITQDVKLQVPLMPSINYENYQFFINHWTSWLQFRNSYMKHNEQANQAKVSEYMQRFTDSLIQQQWCELPSNIPSLYRYYKCLPKFMQEHPGMKDIYLGLEYSAPDYDYEEKEHMINKVCPWLLPFDDISTRVMEDYTAHSRIRPTLFMHQKLLTISPEFTWDIHQFMEQIRREELRGEATNQDKDAKLPQPLEVHKMWEQGAPNLPVDFYDNEDGFWDSIISQKLRRYDEYKPMLKTRRYFTH